MSHRTDSYSSRNNRFAPELPGVQSQKGNSPSYDCLRLATERRCSMTFRVTSSPFSASHTIPRRLGTKKGPPYASTRHHLLMSLLPAVSKSHSHSNQGDFPEPPVPDDGVSMNHWF